MVVAVYTGGPSDFARALIIAIPYFVFGLLVVRRELFAVGVLPFFLSLFVGESGGSEMHVGNPQIVFWLGSVLLILPVLLCGILIRNTYDRQERNQP